MKNKKIYIIIFLSILFIINTLLVLCKVYTPVDSFIHDIYMHTFSSITTKVMKVFTFFGSTLFIILLSIFIFIYFLYKKKNNYAYVSAILIIISTVINNIIKIIIRRPRPIYMMVEENSFSYPSGHTMASVTLYGFIIYLILRSNMNKHNKILFTSLLSILIFMILSSRIYLGAHFFSDIIGGTILSIIIILVFDVINDSKKILK